MQIVSDTATSDPGTGIYFGFVNEQDFSGNTWGRTLNSNSATTNQITHSSILITRTVYATAQGIKQPMSLLYPVDRAAPHAASGR